MNNMFIFPAVVESADDGVGLYFPDVPGTAVLAPDVITAIKDAKNLLIDRIIEMEDLKQVVPQPSNIEDIELNAPSDRIVYIEVFLPPYRDEAANRSVSKNCTLPKWLRDAADEAGLNYSQILQSGIKEALGIEMRSSTNAK